MKTAKKRVAPKLPVTREMLAGAECLNRGRKANADVFKIVTPEGAWVVKDFKKCPWWIRETYGRFMVAHEYTLMKKLEGIRGVPQKVFKLDAYAMGMEFLKGTTVSAYPERMIPERYFIRLEKLMKKVNARGVAHLDTRNAKNVMILSNFAPALVDFQAGVQLKYVPRWLRYLMEHTDLSGVYKHWYNRNAASMDEPRKNILREHFRWRRWWMLKGYTFYKKRVPKGAERELFAEKP